MIFTDAPTVASAKNTADYPCEQRHSIPGPSRTSSPRTDERGLVDTPPSPEAETELSR